MFKTKHLIIVVTVIALGTFVSSSELLADPMTDLKSSPEMAGLFNGVQSNNPNGPPYMEDGSNFASLFVQASGQAKLQEWIAPAEGDFIGGTVLLKKGPEYVLAYRAFTSPGAPEIRVRVVVPHPKFVPMLKYGLVEPFNQYEPPNLEFISNESIEIRGWRADLYVQKKNTCVLVLRLARSSVLHMEQSQCQGLNNLVTLAELLDLKRLERKLLS